MEITELTTATHTLRDLFNSINALVLRLQTMITENKAAVIIRNGNPVHNNQTIEYWILRDYEITDVVQTSQTPSTLSIEFTLKGQGFHGICLSSNNVTATTVQNWILAAAGDDNTSWANGLINNSIFVETGSKIQTWLGTEGPGLLVAADVLGLKTVKFEDEAIIMDEIDKTAINNFILWTNTAQIFN